MKFRVYLVTALAALTFFNNGCVEDRSKLPPDKALLGHWVTESGDAHYYISDQVITETSTTGRGTIQGPYTVVKATNVLNGEIIIKAWFWPKPAGSIQKTFGFTADGKRMVETTYVSPRLAPIEIPPRHWLYVDNKQVP